MTHGRALTAAIGFVFGISLSVSTQNNGVPPAQAKADQQFLKDAAMGGMAEVELGEMAGMKAGTESVKAFGRRMVLDHGKGNDELKALALKKQISLDTMDAPHKATIDKLSNLSGIAFDRAYVDEMVNDHEKAVAAFRREAQTGEDADIKAWAAITLPTLEDHLREIRGVQKDLESGRVGIKKTSG